MHLIPGEDCEGSTQWKSMRVLTNSCELLEEVPNEVVRGIPVEALFALVDHNYPPFDSRWSEEFLVDHVPGTIMRFLPAGELYASADDPRPTTVGRRLS